MRKTLGIAFLAASALSADTLILRDGSRIDGTLVSADERTVSFLNDNGSRRSYNVSNVQEIFFGGGSTDASRTRTELPLNTSTPVDLINRLNDDVGVVMERSRLSSQQRQMLEEARSVLARTGDDLRDNRAVSNREVRMALDNIRYVVNSSAVRVEDRRNVLDNLQRLRDQYREFGGSPSGTRSRYR